MRVLLPGLKVRRRILHLLSTFFDDGQKPGFEEAVRLLAEFYKLPVPHVEWYEYLANGKHLGFTTEDGELRLIHPENWRRMSPGKVFRPTNAHWVQTFLHEFNHYMHYVDDEKKADEYARKFVTGLK